MKQKTLIEKYKAIQAIGTEIAIPYEVWTRFAGNHKTLEIVGSDVSFGGDFASVEVCRKAIGWYVTQLGGKVTWPNEKD